MNSYRVSPEALDDLRGIGDWIAQDDADGATDFLAELQARFGRLASRPLMGRPRQETGANIRSVSHRA